MQCSPAIDKAMGRKCSFNCQFLQTLWLELSLISDLKNSNEFSFSNLHLPECMFLKIKKSSVELLLIVALASLILNRPFILFTLYSFVIFNIQFAF